MKEKELRKHAICSICGQKIGHTGLPLFWTLVIERHGIKMEVIRSQDGLAALLGSGSELAQVVGTDAPMTVTVLGPITVTVCEACAAGDICLMQLAELEVE